MTVVSIRFSDEQVHQRLKDEARRRAIAISTLAERLIDEGLRMRSHPMVTFRDGLTGRRPALAGGPDIVDVVSAIVGGDVPVEQRTTRAAHLLGLGTTLVDAAMAYYAEFTDEVDEAITARTATAEREEAAWRRRHELLGR